MNWPELRHCSDILSQEYYFIDANCDGCLFKELCYVGFELPNECLIRENYVFEQEVDKK